MPTHQSDRRNRVAAVLRDAIAANVAAAVLRTRGVIAVVETPVIGAAPPAPGEQPAGVRLLVAPEDEEHARQILVERGLV